MSRGYDYDERNSQESEIASSRAPLSQGRTGASDRNDARTGLHRSGAQDPERSARNQKDHRDQQRDRDKRYDLSTRERNLLRDVGRFRAIATGDLLKHQYGGKSSAMRKELTRLQQQGLLLKRSISVGKNRNTLHVVALTREGARLARQDATLPQNQSIYTGFVKPAEVPHDAAIYQMYQAEARLIEAGGGKVRRVVLDYEFKKKIYSELNKARDYAELSYARRQDELAHLYNLPMVEGKIALPDLRIEYDTAEGDRAHIDLELATEHYRPSHMRQKTQAGFKLYGVNTTSRGRRAQWEGRELSATVLAL